MEFYLVNVFMILYRILSIWNNIIHKNIILNSSIRFFLDLHLDIRNV